jgi:type IV secretion system protein TrbL
MALVLGALSLLGLGIFGPGIANGIVSGDRNSALAQRSALASSQGGPSSVALVSRLAVRDSQVPHL